MRACLLALLMLFCLPLQWAGVATGTPCALEPCAARHASLTDVPAQAAAAVDASGESHAQHSHCGSCHTGAMAMSASAPFVLSDAATSLPAGPSLLPDALLVERPERPQWSALA
jgi:hypothetical protein